MGRRGGRAEERSAAAEPSVKEPQVRVAEKYVVEAIHQLGAITPRSPRMTPNALKAERVLPYSSYRNSSSIRICVRRRRARPRTRSGSRVCR